MRSLLEVLGENREGRIVLTDSGLGGLSICAGLESRLRGIRGGRTIALVYVNAWPDDAHGYNDLPDPVSRAAILDRALAAMSRYRPDLIVIACNTLSVLYERTAFARSPIVPVAGIVDEGVDLFGRALESDPQASLVVFGTKTTIESGEHVRRLARLSIDARRIRAAACPGLAGVIDKDPDSPALAGLVDACVSRALAGAAIEGRLFAGLACTHYAYVADLFRRSLGRVAGPRVAVLDPNERLVEALAAGMEAPDSGSAAATVTVEVVSKVALAEPQRRAVARRLEPVSPATARALIDYTHIPTLF
jgi:glutamate racemase